MLCVKDTQSTLNTVGTYNDTVMSIFKFFNWIFGCYLSIVPTHYKSILLAGNTTCSSAQSFDFYRMSCAAIGAAQRQITCYMMEEHHG